MIAVLVLSAVTIIYVGLVLYLSFGWFTLKFSKKEPQETSVGISVVIAFREEEDMIMRCLISLTELDYPSDKLEFIFVDDHSLYATAMMINGYLSKYPHLSYQIVSLPEGEIGKKKAIEKAVSLASYDFIACTDADCVLPHHWLKELVSYYFENKKQYRFIAAPVAFDSTKTFLDKVQQIEIGSLITTAAGAIKLKKPIMCNAANLFFEKQLYVDSLRKIRRKYHTLSGDDVFFLHAVREIFGADVIGFCKSAAVIVRTRPCHSMRELLMQRVRWSSKAKNYTDRFARFVAFTVGLMSITILISVLLALFGLLAWKWVALFFTAKFLTDLPLIISWLLFASHSKLIVYYPIVALIYPFYVCLVFLYYFVGERKWKGRPFCF